MGCNPVLSLLIFRLIYSPRIGQCKHIQAGFCVFLTHPHHSLNISSFLAQDISISPYTFLVHLKNQPFSQKAMVPFQFSSVQSLSHAWLFATPWIAARQPSPSITNSQNSLKFMSIESVMPSSHLILCCPLLLLPSIFPSIRVFSNESVLHMR